jgi:hypothetical protein
MLGRLPPQPNESIYNTLPSIDATTGLATHGTQTSPNLTPGSGQAALDQGSPRHGQGEANQPSQAKKGRRRRGKEYEQAAIKRKNRQAHQNYYHPPAPEEIWICEFCEYESIFGAPPVALMRQYEIKDRKERRRQDEKRRLLEKAKQKGRKGKRNSKNAKHAGGGSTQQNAAQAQQQSQNSLAGNGTSSDVFYEDEIEDEYPQDSLTNPDGMKSAPGMVNYNARADGGLAKHHANGAGPGGGGTRAA